MEEKNLMNKRLHNKKALLISILLAAVTILIYKNLPDIQTSNVILRKFVAQLELLVPALIAAMIVKKLGVLKLTGKGFKAGLRAGTIILLASVVNLVIWIMALSIGKTDISVSQGNIVLFLVYCLVIGISEELVSRGIVLEGFFDYFGDDSIQSLRKAIIIAGVLFGITHLTNISGGSEVLSGILSALNNTADGILYCIIYVYSGRNLWPCVFVHAFRDLTSYLLSGFLCVATWETAEGSKGGSSMVQIIETLLLAIIIFTIDYLLMRKQKLQPYVRVSDESTHSEIPAP